MTDQEWRDAWFRGLAFKFWSDLEGKLRFAVAAAPSRPSGFIRELWAEQDRRAEMSGGQVQPAEFAMCECGHRARFHLAKAPFCLMAGCNCRGFVAAEEMVV